MAAWQSLHVLVWWIDLHAPEIMTVRLRCTSASFSEFSATVQGGLGAMAAGRGSFSAHVQRGTRLRVCFSGAFAPAGISQGRVAAPLHAREP